MTNGNDVIYPVVQTTDSSTGRMECTDAGLSKREYFSAMAMQGLLSNPMWMTVYKDERYLMEDKIAAEVSTSYADALIKALNENK